VVGGQQRRKQGELPAGGRACGGESKKMMARLFLVESDGLMLS